MLLIYSNICFSCYQSIQTSAFHVTNSSPKYRLFTSPIHPNISFVRNRIRLARHRPRCPTITISHLLMYCLLPSVNGSKQVGTRFEVIPEPLDQEIRTGQPDLFKGQSGFKHQTGST